MRDIGEVLPKPFLKIFYDTLIVEKVTNTGSTKLRVRVKSFSPIVTEVSAVGLHGYVNLLSKILQSFHRPWYYTPVQLGVIGLGRMGANIARHLLEQKINVVVWNRSPEPREELAKEGAHSVETLEELTRSLKPSRIILMFVPAGPTVDEMIQGLIPHLNEHDVIIDGGNSHYRDSQRRYKQLADGSYPNPSPNPTPKVHFLDMGTSGGLKGAREGACLTIGGDEKVFKQCEWVFKAIAQPKGYAFIGPSGAGHYVKMVHNGIEYALLQSYGEGFQILAEGPYKDLDFSKIADVWSHGSIIHSYLTELAVKAFKDDPRLSKIEGKVGGGETGTWTVQEAAKAGTPTPVLELALKAREASQKKPTFATKVVAVLRNLFGGHSV